MNDELHICMTPEQGPMKTPAETLVERIFAERVMPVQDELLKRGQECERLNGELLTLQHEANAMRKELRWARQRIRHLEAESSAHDVIRMRVRWANRLLAGLTVLGAMGLYKFWLFLF